ncbi:hypothetical protein DFH08DRAFT_800713 [Mycena albidolilacea]|uniref:Uncharacterized protein n=1 Tax=Mycena albidolilacea TaxID=1033008 RepID=A0AAD7AKD9_9AGAR|nr:hypothetical protein DFH08DRAFT_800713 [Mycena albidolilacea]
MYVLGSGANLFYGEGRMYRTMIAQLLESGIQHTGKGSLSGHKMKTKRAFVAELLRAIRDLELGVQLQTLKLYGRIGETQVTIEIERSVVTEHGQAQKQPSLRVASGRRMAIEFKLVYYELTFVSRTIFLRSTSSRATSSSSCQKNLLPCSRVSERKSRRGCCGGKRRKRFHVTKIKKYSVPVFTEITANRSTEVETPGQLPGRQAFSPALGAVLSADACPQTPDRRCLTAGLTLRIFAQVSVTAPHVRIAQKHVGACGPQDVPRVWH